jgi:hypothetical protein
LGFIRGTKDLQQMKEIFPTYFALSKSDYKLLTSEPSKSYLTASLKASGLELRNQPADDRQSFVIRFRWEGSQSERRRGRLPVVREKSILVDFIGLSGTCD